MFLCDGEFMIENAAKKDNAHSVPNVLYTYRNHRGPGEISNTAIHLHPTVEVSFILKGRVRFLCGEQQIHAEKGDLVIICPNVPHSILFHGDVEYEYNTLSFTAGLLKASGRSAEYIEPLMNGSKTLRPHITTTASQYSLIYSTLENIFSCAKDATGKSDMLLKSEMFCLFWLLEQEGAFCTEADKKNEHTLYPALDYINSHYHEQISISHLAALVNLSKNYFMNRFRQATGLTCVEYINKVRINAACEMLLSQKIPVTEVAYACGFGNLSNFNRQFHRVTGTTPRDYRNTEKIPSVP